MSEESGPSREQVTARQWEITELKEHINRYLDERVESLSDLLREIDNQPLKPEDREGFLQSHPWKKSMYHDNREFIYAVEVTERLKAVLRNRKLETSRHSYYMTNSGNVERFKRS